MNLSIVNFRICYTTAQKFQIQYPPKNVAFIEIELGKARNINSFKTLKHIININDYISSIENIKNSLNNLKEKRIAEATIKILLTKAQQITDKVQFMTPRRRDKRGLINGLGTLVKTITGNMDATDAQDIQSRFKNILKNEELLKTNVNLQIAQQYEITNRFKNITEHINQEQKVIDKFINNFQNDVTYTIKYLKKTEKYTLCNI